MQPRCENVVDGGKEGFLVGWLEGGLGIRRHLYSGPIAFRGVEQGSAVVDGSNVLFQFEKLESGQGGQDVLEGGDCFGIEEGVDLVEATHELARA